MMTYCTINSMPPPEDQNVALRPAYDSPHPTLLGGLRFERRAAVQP